MTKNLFRTPAGGVITAVTAAEMQEVDQVAVEDVGLQLLQMMENAGRILAWHVRDIQKEETPVLVVAGNGGNGGGGMACARHLANRGAPVRLIVDRPPDELSGAAATQYRILDEMDIPITTDTERLSQSEGQRVIVDALIGYGLDGEIRPPASGLIKRINGVSESVVSLDVPSGIDATTGETLGIAVTPDRTVTLALPKTGLETVTGALYLADISIPQTVFERLDIEYDRPFGRDDWIELKR
ncbi:NAD(P)H-hydrate epimerase [Halorarius halobius]|uniref:NAD(P)H-hydrate epimerase n=1 Tax=Halorarius halobius TaxID=2962671 RepID=UPI0020CF47E9|nr:NAD(P)H-hydrate epimerase [Halorarius halobius]